MHWKPPRLLVPKRASQLRETGSEGWCGRRPNKDLNPNRHARVVKPG